MIRHDPQELARRWGLTGWDGSTEVPAGDGVTGSHAVNGSEPVESLDLDPFPRVRAALAEPILTSQGAVDRSDTTAAVVGAGYGSALTLPQTRWAVNSRDDLAGWVTECFARPTPRDDVRECWDMIIEDRQRKRQQDAVELFTLAPNLVNGESGTSTTESATDEANQTTWEPQDLENWLAGNIEYPARQWEFSAVMVSNSFTPALSMRSLAKPRAAKHGSRWRVSPK
jgi:hypothetical protein